MRTIDPTNTLIQQRCLDATQTCIYLNISRRFLYSIQRELKALRHGNKLVFDIKELDRYIEKLKAKNSPEGA